MFKAIKEFFTGKPAPVETPAPVAEYKVEAPLVHLGPEPTPVAEQATQAVVESIAPAKKKPAAKKAPAAKKPAVKKPRTPKVPKV
jgi:hypothetical protein